MAKRQVLALQYIYIKNLLKTIHMEGLQSQLQNVNTKVKEMLTRHRDGHQFIRCLFLAVWQKICEYI